MNPVRTYTLILATALLVAGLAGFANGKLSVSNPNTIYGFIHFITGIIGIGAASHSVSFARKFDKVIGYFYGLIGVAGFILSLIIGFDNSISILQIAISITAFAYGYDGESATVQLHPVKRVKSEFEHRSEDAKKRTEEEKKRRRAA